MGTPSSNIVRFASHDPDEFVARLSISLPTDFSVQSLGGRFTVVARAAELPRVGFTSLRLGPTRVRHFYPIDEWGINISLGSPIKFGSGTAAHALSTGTAFVRRPGEGFDMTTRPRSSVFVVHLAGTLLEPLGQTSRDTLQIDPRVSLATPAGESFYRYLIFLWGELERGAGFQKSPLAVHEIEHALAALFVAAVKCPLGGKKAWLGGPAPIYLTRAEEYVRENLSRPLSVLDIAAAAGISARTLSAAFQKYRGVPTSAFVKQSRLEATQRALERALPAEISVRNVALRYGFTHMGRFAAAYRRAFQEKPSATLRR